MGRAHAAGVTRRFVRSEAANRLPPTLGNVTVSHYPALVLRVGASLVVRSLVA